MTSAPRNTYVCTVSENEAKVLKSALAGKNFNFRDVPYAQWGAFTKEVNIVLYAKGKLVVQGKGTQDFVQFFLEPEILKRVGFGYEALLAEQSGSSHIGIDESGKGDYFGPLVIAGAYVQKENLGKLVDWGVKDSKKLSSKMVEKLSKMIKGICPFSLVVIGPERYNALYEKIKNLNRLLAWGHARTIENLLSKVDCDSVVLDQFGGKHLVLNALMEKGKKVNIQQMHHGEQDLAVAAASILARQEFLDRMAELSQAAGLEIPRGAGARVEEVARTLFEKMGRETFSKWVKIHFKITQKIFGEERAL